MLAAEALQAPSRSSSARTSQKRHLRRPQAATARRAVASTAFAAAEVKVVTKDQTVGEALGSWLAKAAAASVKERGSFTVAFAGGSLPSLLEPLHNRTDVDWSKWHIFTVDERCVPHSHHDSNVRSLRMVLLHKPAPSLPPNQIYAIDESLCTGTREATEAAAADYERRMRSLPASTLPRDASGMPVLDAAVLGFGPDGHIASLFPGHALLTEPAGKWVQAIHDSPKLPPHRITLSLSAINAARLKCFAVKGKEKADIVHRILGERDRALPAALVEGNVTWILDECAARELPGPLRCGGDA